MNVKKFQKRKEDFVCEHCAYNMKGNGYTNHCSKCLWSKHVDIFPGDRLEPCQGMMKPIGFKKIKRDDVLVHECVVCGYRKNNKVSVEDDVDMVAKISALPLCN